MALATKESMLAAKSTAEYAHRYFNKIVDGEIKIRELTDFKSISQIFVVDGKDDFDRPKLLPLESVTDMQKGMDIVVRYNSTDPKQDAMDCCLYAHNLQDACVVGEQLLLATDYSLFTSPDIKMLNEISNIAKEQGIEILKSDIVSPDIRAEFELADGGYVDIENAIYRTINSPQLTQHDLSKQCFDSSQMPTFENVDYEPHVLDFGENLDYGDGPSR